MSEELNDFLALLADPSEPIPAHRVSSLSDLNQSGFKRFLTVWHKLDDARRRELIELLGREADAHIELLFEAINRLALRDPDANVRRMAIDNLWECEDHKLIPPLLDALEHDENDLVRAAAAKALGRFVLLGQMEQIAQTKLASIEQLLFKAHQEDSSPAVHLATLESIGFSSHDDVNQFITDAFQKEDSDTKQSAIKAMGRSANDAWGTQVIYAMQHHSPNVRGEAAIAAGELELKEAIASLIDLLDDAHPGVVEAAVWALGHVGGKQAEEALIAFSELNEDPELKVQIDEALEYLAFVNGLMDFSIFDFDNDPEASDIE